MFSQISHDFSVSALSLVAKRSASLRVLIISVKITSSVSPRFQSAVVELQVNLMSTALLNSHFKISYVLSLNFPPEQRACPYFASLLVCNNNSDDDEDNIY